MFYFLALRHFHPRISLDVADLFDIKIRKSINKKKPWIFLKLCIFIKICARMIIKLINQSVKSRQQIWKRSLIWYLNKIWLSTKNIITDWPSNKLHHYIINFLRLVPKKNISSKLYLAYAMKIQNVFHSKLFWKFLIDLLIGQVNEPAPSKIVYNKEK